jgi:hypothetical protein
VKLEGWSARMRHRKFYDIRSNVTRRASPGKYGSAHVVSELSLGCSLGHPAPITLFPGRIKSTRQEKRKRGRKKKKQKKKKKKKEKR